MVVICSFSEQSEHSTNAQTMNNLTPDGTPLGVTVINPMTGKQPVDLMLYLGDLSWRSAGTIEHDRLFLDENDTGPDDAVHSKRGIFILYDPTRTWGEQLSRELHLTDITPTILRLMGHAIPPTMRGTPLEVA